MATPNRQRILSEHGLPLAPRRRQREFWQAYNTTRRHRRTQPLGGFLVRALRGEGGSAGGGVPPEVRAAWDEALPAEFAGQARPEALVDGVLSIAVRSASARYALERVLGGALLAALRRQCGRGRVRKMVFRLAGGDEGPASTDESDESGPRGR